MRRISFSVFLFVAFFFFISSHAADEAGKNGVYIVYMGSPSASTGNGSSRNDYARLLTSVARRKRNAVVHTYKHGFSGFAARLSEQEANAIRNRPGVVSVFPDPVMKLQRTHSSDFFISQTSAKIDAKPKKSDISDSSSSSSQAYDSIIGILDTGTWEGSCMHGNDFTSYKCNSRMASKAAGSAMSNAPHYGLAARRSLPRTPTPGLKIAKYEVCEDDGCHGSAIMAAIDDAIADGVAVLLVPLGSSSMKPELKVDPIAIGAFHAAEKGIVVVCSAGTDGHISGSVLNDSPWILTVSASAIVMAFESDVALGSNKVIKGEGVHSSSLQKSPVYPLIHSASAQNDFADEDSARSCNLDSMDGDLVRGKIVICENVDGDMPWEYKVKTVKFLRGVGAVLIDDEAASLVAEKFSDFPISAISSKDGAEVCSYANSSGNPVATILPTVMTLKYKPAPTVANSSSKESNPAVLNLLKPDISVREVNNLKPWIDPDSRASPSTEGDEFNLRASFASTVVSIVAGRLRAQNPSWGPSVIKSVIMTTATQVNNTSGSPLTTNSGSLITPYDYGAGEVLTNTTLHPGLVYETITIDYLNYLCYFGYDLSTIKMISETVPDDFACPKNSKADSISNMNYPSIAVSELKGGESKTVIRTVTNVGGDGETVYTVSVEAPSEVDVKVIPENLEFTKNNQKQSFQVAFTSTVATLKEQVFGSITWTNGQYSVRSPFVVS